MTLASLQYFVWGDIHQDLLLTTVPGYKKSDSVPPLEVDNGEATVEDEEYARIFSRMAELEKEEEEAELEKEEEEAELENEEEDAEAANGSNQDLQIQNEQKDNKHDFPDPEVISVPVCGASGFDLLLSFSFHNYMFSAYQPNLYEI